MDLVLMCIKTSLFFIVLQMNYHSVKSCGASITIYGPSIGPCVDHECPQGYMCINDVCVKGCYDTCSDCHCYLGYCGNPMYARRMQCCNRSCGNCTP